MRIKWMIPMLVFVLFALMACEQDILKPDTSYPENALMRPMFDRDSLISPDGSFREGYRNYYIQADKIHLHWQRSDDENFLCYKLYRDDDLIRTIDRQNAASVVDSLLSFDTYYHYTVAVIMKSGMSKVDTLTVKTASLAAPTVYSRINTNNTITVRWRDNSDIPGEFQFFIDNVLMATFSENTNFTEEYWYSYMHVTALPNVNYTYSIRKVGLYSESGFGYHSVYNSYSMQPPSLLGELDPDELAVNLNWIESCSSETGYRIYRKRLDEGTDFLLLANITSPLQRDYRDTYNLQYGFQYQYVVTALDWESSPPVETEYSNVITLNLDDPAIFFYDFTDGQIPDNWYFAGHANWYITNSMESDGNYLRSGDISNNQYSRVLAYCTIPYGTLVTVEFDLYISSESGCDYLDLLINGAQYDSFDGEAGWEHHSYQYESFVEGSNVISFSYVKDSSFSEGLDGAKIDNLKISYIDDGVKHFVNFRGEK